uniref:Uncharacterized protein n=1 Tax=Quercus lobata TaxID=97700 RepID=A0A7N2LC83_QUELO
MFAELIGNEKPRYRLTEEQVFDQIFTILYSGRTVSNTRKKKPDEPIDWNVYKSMSFTRAVILETSRLATIVNGLLRKTTQDVELNGMFNKLMDSSFQKDREYMFSQGSSTMIQSPIQSLLHSILRDGWIRAWSLTAIASYLELEAGCVLERNWAWLKFLHSFTILLLNTDGRKLRK